MSPGGRLSFTTATSVAGSLPTTRASNRRSSPSCTHTSSAPATTWLLVRMMPALFTMKPEPSPSWVSRRVGASPIPKRSRKYCVKGSSRMTRGMTFMLWMVTTEAFTRSTKGATEAPISFGAGTDWADVRTIATANERDASIMAPILQWCGRHGRPALLGAADGPGTGAGSVAEAGTASGTGHRRPDPATGSGP